jgi:PPM family protein phosphatase
MGSKPEHGSFVSRCKTAALDNRQELRSHVDTQESAPSPSVRRAVPGIEVGVATHIGRRNANADAACVDEAAVFFCVADGMRDTPRSSLVAQMAIDAIREFFVAPCPPPAARDIDQAGGRLRLGVERAHFLIYAPSIVREERIGTTFAGVVLCGGLLCIGHVGDSRIYMLRGSNAGLAQLMEDHTVAGDACRQGMASEAAMRLPNAHQLTQVIGVRRVVDIRPLVRRWEPGDMVLLCTDGVSNCLQTDAMASIMLGACDLNAAAQTLVERAIEEGGWDNATALVLRRVS